MLVSGELETSGDRGGALSAKDADGNALDCGAITVGTLDAAIDRIVDLLASRYLPAPEAVGHRIVHGGPGCRQHTLIDASVLAQLEAAKIFAPLHVPLALALVRCAQQRFPAIPQAACLDTAFHAGMPDVARTLPIPRELRRLGIERYGFHGLSCESILRQLGKDLPKRLVIAHLGHGASVTAVANGRSIDTSMGLTPSGGVIMSTRCGDIDPGVLEHLVRELGYDATQLEALIDQQSGMFWNIRAERRHARAACSRRVERRGESGHRDVLLFGAQAGWCDGCGARRHRYAGVHRRNWRERRGSARKHLRRLGRVGNPYGFLVGLRVIPSQEDVERIAQHTWRLAMAA